MLKHKSNEKRNETRPDHFPPPLTVDYVFPYSQFLFTSSEMYWMNSIILQKEFCLVFVSKIYFWMIIFKEVHKSNLRTLYLIKRWMKACVSWHKTYLKVFWKKVISLFTTFTSHKLECTSIPEIMRFHALWPRKVWHQNSHLNIFLYQQQVRYLIFDNANLYICIYNCLIYLWYWLQVWQSQFVRMLLWLKNVKCF